MPICTGSYAPFNPSRQRTAIVNRIVWLVGAVVIILFVLGFFGLR